MYCSRSTRASYNSVASLVANRVNTGHKEEDNIFLFSGVEVQYLVDPTPAHLRYPMLARTLLETIIYNFVRRVQLVRCTNSISKSPPFQPPNRDPHVYTRI